MTTAFLPLVFLHQKTCLVPKQVVLNMASVLLNLSKSRNNLRSPILSHLKVLIASFNNAASLHKMQDKEISYELRSGQ
jgi:hypothetical protein